MKIKSLHSFKKKNGLKRKSNPQSETKYLQHIYLKKGLCSEYLQHSKLIEK